MMYWNGHMTGADWVFSIFGSLLLLTLVIGVIFLVVSALGNRSTNSPASDASARGILDRRLATGELTVEQYHELRDALGDGVATRADRQALQASGTIG
jgi:uncharacterized membrane protein